MACLAFAMPAPATDVQDRVGFTALSQRPGALLARGAGISVGLVEDDNDVFLQFEPDLSSPEFVGKNFLHFPTVGATSVHATMTASVLFGNTSGIAPAVSDVHLYLNDSFVSTPLNRISVFEPDKVTLNVINHSWAGSTDDASQDLDIVRRLDFMIRRDNVVSVHALRNRPDSAFPNLLASSYNGITVGALHNPRHGFEGSSLGPVSFDGGRNRAKPDLIAAAPTASEAAAAVSGSAALLLSEAKARGMKFNAMATKAVLMVAADRLKGYYKGERNKRDDQAVPLSFSQGAGLLRVDKAFDVLADGKAPKNRRDLDLQGWDVRRSTPRKPTEYFIRFAEDVTEFDAVLTWHRKVAGSLPFDRALESVPNLDLLLYRDVNDDDSGGSAPRPKWKLVSRSLSKIDNVETFFTRKLHEGSYKMVVKPNGNVKEYFALAWDADLKDQPASALASPLSPLEYRDDRSGRNRGSGDLGFHSVPEPGAAALLLPLLFALRRRRRTPETHRAAHVISSPTGK